MLTNDQFPQMAQPARTAYDIRYENTLSPFVRAKYGLGGGALHPTSWTQLAAPQQAAGAATPPSPQLAQFGPSSGVDARLSDQQFGRAP